MQNAQFSLTLLRRSTTCAILAEGRNVSGMESGMSTVLVLSGVSTRETLKTYAYRLSIVLRRGGRHRRHGPRREKNFQIHASPRNYIDSCLSHIGITE